MSTNTATSEVRHRLAPLYTNRAVEAQRLVPDLNKRVSTRPIPQQAAIVARLPAQQPLVVRTATHHPAAMSARATEGR